MIERYGILRPSGVGRTPNDVRIEALTNLGKTVSDLSFGIASKRRAEKGKEEGYKAGEEAAKKGKSPAEQKSLFPTFYGEAFNDAQQAAYLAGVDRQAVERLSELETEHELDYEAYDAAATGLLQGLISDAPESYRPALNESIGNYISRGRTRITKNIANKSKEEAKSELLGAIDTYSREASRAARNGDAEAAQDYLDKTRLSADALVASGEWTKEQADESVRRARNEKTEQDYLQVVDDLPLSEASKAISDAEKNVPEGFSGDEWDSLIARARTRLQTRIVEAKKGTATDKSVYRARQASVEIAIKTGEGDPDQILLELTDLFKNDIYTPSQYAGHVATVYNDLRKTQKVWDRVENNDPSILVDPSAIDKVYRKDIAGLEPSQKVQFAASVNHVPSQLKEEIANALYSGDIRQAADGADLIKRMDEIQGLPDAFSSKDRAYASQITELMSVLTAEEAVRMARKNTDPRDKARIDARKQELKDEYNREDWQKGAEKAIGPWFGSIDPMVAPQIANDYKAVFEAHYIAGMEADSAHKEAERVLKNNYSDWNGRPTKHSPEKYYQVDGSADWVHDDVKNTLKDYIAGAPDILDYYLYADDTTEREASAGQPSYIVRFRTADGWDALRYRPDVDAAKAKKTSFNEDLIKEMRKKSSMTYDPTPPLFGN